MFINALGIAEGTDPAPALSATPTDDDKIKLEDWKKCFCQGLSLLLVSVRLSIHQSLDIKKTINKSATVLQAIARAYKGL